MSVFGLSQRQDYRVTRLAATVGGFPAPGFDAGIFRGIENEVAEYNVKLDAWLLPFVNVFAVLGRVDGEARVGLSPAVAPMLGGAARLDVKYDGLVYGAGLTLAVGHGNWFGSVSGTYTRGEVDIGPLPGLVADNPRGIETLVVVPKAGYRIEGLTLWAGGYYQATEHTQAGAFRPGPPMGDVRFEVEVRDARKWGSLAGIRYDLTERWSFTVEAGFSGRRQFMAAGDRRF